MGGGLESRCLGRVYGADGAVHHIAVGAPTPLSSHFITNVNHPDAVTVIAGGGGAVTPLSPLYFFTFLRIPFI